MLGVLGAAPPPPPAQGTTGTLVVDRVVARVDSEVITQSELTAEARLVLLDAGNPNVAVRTELTPGLLSAVLRSMVHRALLMNERRRLQLGSVPDEEVAQDVERLARRFEDRDDFRIFVVDIGLADPDAGDLPYFRAPAAIVNRLRVEREVSRFVDVRIRLNVVLNDRELRACFNANAKRFSKLTFEQAQPQIRVRLQQQKEERALTELLASLAQRAKIRVEPPYDLPVEEEPDEDIGFDCPRPGA